MSADGSVKSRSSIVYSVLVAWAGATDGDIVALRDGGATGTVRFRMNIPSTNGSQQFQLGKYGVRFNTDIYYTESCAAPDTIWTTVVYD
jgi:hypothetical protein